MKIMRTAILLRHSLLKNKKQKKYSSEDQAGESQRVANKIDKGAEVRNYFAIWIVNKIDQCF